METPEKTTVEKVEAEKTVLLFDETLQKEVPHTLDIDANGEVVLTSTKSGHSVKLPRGTDGDALKAFIKTHKEQNAGKITVAALEKQKEELLASL